MIFGKKIFDKEYAKRLAEWEKWEELVLEALKDPRTDRVQRFFVDVSIETDTKVRTWKIEKSSQSEDDLPVRVQNLSY